MGSGSATMLRYFLPVLKIVFCLQKKPVSQHTTTQINIFDVSFVSLMFVSFSFNIVPKQSPL